MQTIRNAAEISNVDLKKYDEGKEQQQSKLGRFLLIRCQVMVSSRHNGFEIQMSWVEGWDFVSDFACHSLQKAWIKAKCQSSCK